MRKALFVLSIVGLLAVGSATSATADQGYRTERVPITTTAAGLAAGYQPLDYGQAVNIHAEGPTIFAVENILLRGAKPSTTFVGQRWVYAGNCSGPFVGALYDERDIHTTDAHGFMQNTRFIYPSDIPMHDTDLGVAFVLVDGNGVPVYATPCTNVHID